MKKKGSGMVMVIMIVSILGWVAIVSLIIKPSIWLGLIIVPLGGIAIGLGICFLIWRWWLKGPLDAINILKWITNKSYRKHLWARQHLDLTRIMKHASMDYHKFWGRQKPEGRRKVSLN